MCCFQYRKSLGNILKEGFQGIWFGPIAESVRNETLAKRFHPSCQTQSCPYLHLKELPMQETEFKQFPVEFELDLPNQHCNIGGLDPTEEHPACLMCERHLFYEKQEDRLDEVCALLNPYVKHIRALHIQGIAEAFWKDRIFEVLEKLGVPQYKKQITISTTTNGTILNEARRKRWFTYPRSVITFSIDAATSETFKLIRRVDMFDKVVETMKSYAKEKKKGQQLRIHNNINLLNIHEVVGMVKLGAECGVDNIDFNPTYNTPGICIEQETAYLFAQAQEKITQASKDYGVKVSFMRNLTLDFEIQEPQLIQINLSSIKNIAKQLAIPVSKLTDIANNMPVEIKRDIIF
jgi:hypothetical protein